MNIVIVSEAIVGIPLAFWLCLRAAQTVRRIKRRMQEVRLELESNPQSAVTELAAIVSGQKTDPKEVPVGRL